MFRKCSAKFEKERKRQKTLETIRKAYFIVFLFLIVFKRLKASAV